ncbi:ribonuclease H-like domain-containing protein [Tanacetum coccineum]
MLSHEQIKSYHNHKAITSGPDHTATDSFTGSVVGSQPGSDIIFQEWLPNSFLTSGFAPLVKVLVCEFKDPGRLQLVQSVIASLHVFWASVFILPSCILLEIEPLMRGFIWCNGGMRRGKSKIPTRSVIATVGRFPLRVNRHVWLAKDIAASPTIRRVRLVNKVWAGLTISSKVIEVLQHGVVMWPHELFDFYPILALITSPTSIGARDCLEWLDIWGMLNHCAVKVVWQALRPRDVKVQWVDVLIEVTTKLCNSQACGHGCCLFFMAREECSIVEEELEVGRSGTLDLEKILLLNISSLVKAELDFVSSNDFVEELGRSLEDIEDELLQGLLRNLGHVNEITLRNKCLESGFRRVFRCFPGLRLALFHALRQLSLAVSGCIRPVVRRVVGQACCAFFLTLSLSATSDSIQASSLLELHKYHVDGSLSRYKARLVANGRTSSPAFLQRVIASLHGDFAMTNLGKTPVDIESKFGANGDPVSDPMLYRSLASALQYLTFTRPDISYAVQHVFLYMHDPREPHLVALKRISCYVTLSRSSAEAEYKGVANMVVETAWVRNILCELHAPLFTATLVYCDNVSAVYLSTNPVQHQRTKHTV